MKNNCLLEFMSAFLFQLGLVISAVIAMLYLPEPLDVVAVFVLIAVWGVQIICAIKAFETAILDFLRR